MHLGLTYDLQTDPADERQAEFDSPRTLEALQGALESLGHHVTLIGNAHDLMRGGCARWRDIDLVFNIAEGTAGRCREAWVPMLLEQWGIPFVGSNATAQILGLDKVMSKRLARACGVPTPAWRVVESVEALGLADDLSFPLIVKPRYEGSGLGVDPGAVVADTDALRRRVVWTLERFQQPCLIEQFIPFGELTVVLIGNGLPRALPAIQRPLDPASRLSCHVVPPPAASAEGGSAAAAAGVLRWRSGGGMVRGGPSTSWLCPVELTPALDARASSLAVTVFEALGCRDMARVDLRVDQRGALFFLEINPLPSFDPEGSFGLIAEYLGVAYADLIGRILNAACDRLGIYDGQRAQPA